MLGFLVDNIYVPVVFGDQIFQQSIGIPMGTNCAPLLADLFLYSYKAEFVQRLLQDKNKELAVSFNYTYRYIDVHQSAIIIFSYVHLIYLVELKIKGATESDKSASYLDILLNTLQRANNFTSVLRAKRQASIHVLFL
jgi:hypothetical protein